jgi:hypothetical protein
MLTTTETSITVIVVTELLTWNLLIEKLMIRSKIQQVIEKK